MVIFYLLVISKSKSVSIVSCDIDSITVNRFSFKCLVWLIKAKMVQINRIISDYFSYYIYIKSSVI